MLGRPPGGVREPFSGREAPALVGPRMEFMLGMVRSTAGLGGVVPDGADVVRGRLEGGNVFGGFGAELGSDEYGRDEWSVAPFGACDEEWPFGTGVDTGLMSPGGPEDARFSSW